MLDLSRRGFITGLSALIAAPAIVRAQNIMPVRVIKPEIYMEPVGIIRTLDVSYGFLRVRPDWLLYSLELSADHRI